MVGSMTTAALIRTPDELTTDWLAGVLGAPVRAFTTTPVGTGQMSESHRVTLDWDGTPASVVLKVAASDPTSRATGVGLGAYEREIRFYQQLAGRLDGPVARCHAAVYDAAEGWFTLLLEDVAPASQGDQIAGCTVAQAELAMRELARLHAPVLGDVELGAADWLNLESPLNQGLVAAILPAFFERYDERIAPEHHALIERFAQSIDGWAADRRAPQGLVHGDFRLDNMLFGEAGSPRPFTIVDWQTMAWGPTMVDASYFLGGGLATEDRRAHEESLVRTYHEGLLALGIHGFPWEHCWSEYRRASFAGVLMAVAASMLVVRTERGDEMFMTLVARHAQHALDLDAVALLPEPGAGRPAPLCPEADDEGRHAPGAEQLWNESWYFDAVSEDGSLGAYVRIGLYPQLGVAWYTTYVVGPGRASVAVIDYEAPLPATGLALDTGTLRADHVCEAPLQRFRVTLDGTGEAHDEAAAALRGEAGRPVRVALDLVWETDGEPYAYRLATRYEIPCRVSGTIRVGDETLELNGPGQRDHSWGPRDWWSMDWVWSALHLDDGTRLHAVELRLPELPRLGVGYVQSGGELAELDAVHADEHAGPDGLITRASLALEPAGLHIDVEPLAFGPLRLVAPDGRIAEFPRALCRARTADGRSGLGWVEWNRNVGA